MTIHILSSIIILLNFERRGFMIWIYKMLKNLKRCVICFFEILNNPGKVIDEIFYVPEVFNPLDKSEIDDILSKKEAIQ